MLIDTNIPDENVYHQQAERFTDKQTVINHFMSLISFYAI